MTVQVQVDGETIATAVHNADRESADRESADRNFSAVPSY